MKTFFLTVGGAIGAAVAWLFGGWSAAATALCVFMAIDYITGVIVALVFHKSPKTESGGLASWTGFKGLAKKFAILLIIAVANWVDILIGTTYIRDATAIAFCLNEVLSIVENVGLMGVPIPAVLRHGIDVLNKKAEQDSREKTEQNVAKEEEQ